MNNLCEHGIGLELPCNRCMDHQELMALNQDKTRGAAPDYSKGKTGTIPIENPKFYQGMKKVLISAVPWTVIMEIGLGMMEGALKGYRRHNYRVAGRILASTYYDATMRHLAAWWEGQDYDADSKAKLHHVSKAIASLTVLRDSMIVGTFADDRPPRPPADWMVELNQAAEELVKRYPNAPPPYTHFDLSLASAGGQTEALQRDVSVKPSGDAS